MSTWNTYTLSSNGFAIAPERGERPPATPAGLIVSRAVETKTGWVGQVIVDKEILWESESVAGSEGEDPAGEAQRQANARIVERIKTLFGDA